MGTSIQAPSHIHSLHDNHHHARPYQNFVGFLGQHRSSPNVLPSRHLHAQIFLLKTLHIFSHLHMVHSVHFGCSISKILSVHQGATLQAEAALSAASYSLKPPSCSIHHVPSSSLRVTCSDAHHTIVTLHLIPIIKPHPPAIFQVSNLSKYHRQPRLVLTGVQLLVFSLTIRALKVAIPRCNHLRLTDVEQQVKVFITTCVAVR